MSRRTSPGCVVDCGQPSTETDPPVTTAAARNGAALLRSGSTSVSSGGDGSGGDDPSVRLAVIDHDAALPQHGQSHLDVRLGGDRFAVVHDVDTAAVPGSGEQQGRDELARSGRVERDGPALDLAGPLDRERQCPRRTANLTPSVLSASRISLIGRSRARGSPSKSTRPSASAATAGTKRITVPARPQSTDAGPVKPCGTIRRPPPDSSMVVPIDVSAETISRVSRASSAPVTVDGPVGQCREQHRPVGDRLRAGHDDSRRTGEVANGASHGVSTDVVTAGATQPGVSLSACLAAFFRARPAPLRAIHARLGLPSVSTLARSSPPIIETFLKKCTCWLARC